MGPWHSWKAPSTLVGADPPEDVELDGELDVADVVDGPSVFAAGSAFNEVACPSTVVT